jgi:hypothetical protein
MNTLPFLTISVHGKKDAIRARQRARQVAALLGYPPSEQACIAAGTFVIACQGVAQLGKCVLGLHIENHQLHVFIQDGNARRHAATGPVNRVAPLRDDADVPLVRLVKPVPAERSFAEEDLAFLARNTTSEPGNLFEEVVKQNQEVLTLLHELYACQRQRDEGQPVQPHAA